MDRLNILQVYIVSNGRDKDRGKLVCRVESENEIDLLKLNIFGSIGVTASLAGPHRATGGVASWGRNPFPSAARGLGEDRFLERAGSHAIRVSDSIPVGLKSTIRSNFDFLR